VAEQEALQRVAHICEPVPAVGDLDGVGRALARAVGIDGGAVARDDLDARVRRQPGGERLRRPVGQQVDEAVALQVDEHRTVAAPAPPRPVVDAQHARRRDGRRHRAQQPEEGVGAGRHAEVADQVRPALAASRQGDRGQQRREPVAPPTVLGHQPGNRSAKMWRGNAPS
jgi:hypothetical protein